MKYDIWLIISRILESLLFIMGVWSIWKADWIWAFACFFGFFLSLSPVIMKKSLKFSLPWILQFFIVFAISLHIWGGVLHFYRMPFYDKIAHFLASAIIAFFALLVIYILDVFSPRIHMDIFIIGFFIIIFTIAIGGIWEIAEFLSDQIFSHGTPIAQVSLQNTMWDLIADTIAGIFVGVGGAIGLRKGEFKDILSQLSSEAKKLNKRYINSRKKAIDSLNREMEMGKVDEKALPIVSKINGKLDFFTTSSCSGRIAILEIPSIGRKKKAKFLGKWHRKVKEDEIKEAIEKATKGDIWFLVQSPIFHVSTISMENARKLLAVANQSGFKYSSIKAFNGRVVVEILGTERIDAPIGKDGEIYGGSEYIKILTDVANQMMDRMDYCLRRLEENIDRMLSE